MNYLWVVMLANGSRSWIMMAQSWNSSVKTPQLAFIDSGASGNLFIF